MIQNQAIRARRAIVLVLPLLSSSMLHAQTPPQYSVEILCSETGAADINQAGVVVGSSTIAGHTRGWIAAHGQPLTPLPLPSGRISSWTRGINDQGVIEVRTLALAAPARRTTEHNSIEHNRRKQA